MANTLYIVHILRTLTRATQVSSLAVMKNSDNEAKRSFKKSCILN